MSYELIAKIILVFSLIGIGVIIFRKIPVLVKLPETPIEFDIKAKILKIKEKIKNWKYFPKFSFEIYLQKILSKIRILTLKIENKTDNLLQKLREKTKKKKIAKNDNYWEEIKKSTKNK